MVSFLLKNTILRGHPHPAAPKSQTDVMHKESVRGQEKERGESCETTAMREKMEREKGGKKFLIAVSAAAPRFNALPAAVVVEEATLPLGKRGGKGKGPILP